MARIPAGAYEDYLALGTERSYQALAARYGVSKTAVVKRAKKERWQDRLADLERQARERAEEKAVDEMDAVRERHLKEARFLQARALQALKDLPPEKGIRAASALSVAWKHELLLLGEPTERQANVEELIKRETRDLLMVVDDDDTALNEPEWGPGGS
jgi:ATPase subunit of ABC transporter with duplicated ATPase domains